MIKSIEHMHLLGKHLINYPDVLCLLGLGSMSEVDRADKYSDMDFFLIVSKDKKINYLNNLDWLNFRPIVFQFKNSNDGYKVLFDDGTYAEFAIFTPDEIINAVFTKGLIYYKKPDFDEQLVLPMHSPSKKKVDVTYNLNEALTNIYVGLTRLRRGEIASATTFIQTYAYNLIIFLFADLYESQEQYDDPFVYERRIEFRFNESNNLLPKFRQGYIKNRESAKEMMKFLSNNFELNQHLTKVINQLLD